MIEPLSMQEINQATQSIGAPGKPATQRRANEANEQAAKEAGSNQTQMPEVVVLRRRAR